MVWLALRQGVGLALCGGLLVWSIRRGGSDPEVHDPYTTVAVAGLTGAGWLVFLVGGPLVLAAALLDVVLPVVAPVPDAPLLSHVERIEALRLRTWTWAAGAFALGFFTVVTHRVLVRVARWAKRGI